MRRHFGLLSPLVGLFLAAVFIAGCGSSSAKSGPATSATGGSAPTTAAGSSPAQVLVIKNFAYSPSTLTVTPGAEVTVKNEDTAVHTVTAVGPHMGAFDTGDIQPGSSKTFKAPASPGTYPYICNIHQFMHGTLVVR